MRDTLAVLARLRRLETEQARRLLAERLGRTAAAEARAEEAEVALDRERAAGAERPADHAAWLRRGLAERERAGLTLGLARRAEGEAREGLAAARAAARAVDLLKEERAARRARDARRAEQARLDDAVAARR